MKRILALDVGRRRIGLAAGQEDAPPVPLGAMKRGTMREDIARLEQMARERKVEGFVVGLPLHMDGRESEMTAFVRTFVERLERETGLRVEYQDERLSSVEAERRMEEGGMSLKKMLKQKRGGAVDSLAALVLLEDYMRRTAE